MQVHTPRLVSGRIREGWNEIIDLHKRGYARSIGVSNYTLDDMKELLEGGEKAPSVVPAVNQIELHPYTWNDYRANVEYCQSKVRLERESFIFRLFRELTLSVLHRASPLKRIPL